MLRSKSRSGYLEFGQKKHSSLLSRSISGSKICRGDSLASQVDKQALVSVDRNSISFSKNRIVKAAMMQKQLSNLEEELENTKKRFDEAEKERNRAIAELREAKELANAGLSPKKAEQAFSELKSLKDLLSNARKEIESRDKEMTLLNKRLESAKAFEVKLGEREESLEKLKEELRELKDSEAHALSENKKRIRELEDQVEKTKQSESNMLESLMFQTQQIEQTKMDLEESKLEIIMLHEQLERLQKANKNWTKDPMVDRKGPSPETQASKDEITMLKSELKLATEAEEKSKKAMDDLASALREVATEASVANEKLRLSEEKVTQLNKEIEKLNIELKAQTNTAEQLRIEAEESLLAWNGKEMGFVSCIKKADEESALTKHENNKLKEALIAAESTTRIAREEAFKLRDLLKQALNESNAAKEASNIARAENSELKDLLAEKEDALHFLTKENERLRINEVAARENVKEFKRLLAAKAEVIKPYEDKEQNDVFNSPLSSLYEDHLDGRTTPQQTFSFDLDELKVFSKEEDDYMFYKEEDEEDVLKFDDPEKAEALKGSIFDTSASPRSEPQTPKTKVQQKKASSVHADSSGTVQSEEAENNVQSSSNNHTEDTEDKSFYSRKKLFRKMGELIMGKNSGKKEASFTDPWKIGELIIGKTYSKKETSTEQPKEQAKEQVKDQVN